VFPREQARQLGELAGEEGKQEKKNRSLKKRGDSERRRGSQKEATLTFGTVDLAAFKVGLSRKK